MPVDSKATGDNAAAKDIAGLREDVSGMRLDIQKVLDNQALLVALFKEGRLECRAAPCRESCGD